MKGTWRDIARPIIARVLAENEGKTEQEKRKALKDAYPFGARQWHPYKIWLSEIKVQTKQKRFGQKKENMKAEAIQVAAMAIRFLENLK